MNIPAYTVPTLSRLGCTFDCNTSRNCIEIFPPDIPANTENVNTFSFQYKVVTTNGEVKELMHLPFDLPLRVKANLLSVVGPGKYLNDLKIEEGKTEILAVMTCITVSKAIEDSERPNEILKRENLVEGLGTHYVRRVLYGAQMVASIKLDFPANAARRRLTGTVEGELTSQAAAAAFSNQLETILTDCRSASNISITYYTSEAPYQSGTSCSLEELMGLFRGFSSKAIDGGKEIPIEVELQPTGTLIPSAKGYLPNMALRNAVEEVESRFDDLRTGQYLVKTYLEGDAELDEDMRRFKEELEKVSQIFADTISSLDVSAEESQFDDCLMAYENALDGYDEEGKFVHFWRKLLTKRKAITSSIQLPQGKDLTIAVIGKAGSGKSATANSIVGKHIFTTSAWATTTVSSEFQSGRRIEERRIYVLDTPGSLKTEDFQKEVPRILELAPDGFDAIVLVAKYGCRLTTEDAQALQLLQEFLGDKANQYIILVFTFGDQAEHEAKEDRVSLTLDAYLAVWQETLPDWVQTFIQQIDDRVVFFNNRLKPDSQPDAYKTQLSQLIQAIDGVTKTTSPYLHTKESREDFERKIKEAARRPRRAEKKSDDWYYVPDPKTPIAVPIGEPPDVVAADEGFSFRERVWEMLGTYCRIL